MSFSKDLKQELSKLNNLAKKDQVKQELIGYLISSNTSVDNKENVRYATENEYNINRFSKLLKNMNVDFKIEMEGKTFVIKFNLKESKIVTIENSEIFQKENNLQEEQKKALIRGVFLGSGSINNPENKYHLEITFSNKENLNNILQLLKEFGISFKPLNSSKKHSIYIKEGEEISNFLALIGANSSVLKFEDIRIQREMRGKVNRLVNCKSANLNKTINASVEQINAIKKLQANKKFNKLDDNLKEIAKLRLENPDMPLSELGKLLSNPVGKSGVNYRLKKIIEIANEL
ncbi:MAG: DNA-binding protein WhiA [Clostridia bacterium]|nr:DNA-binding protein WhiA [Clostridia bacterium]